MIQFRNETDTICAIPSLDLLVRPGETVGIPEGYALPRKRSNGEKRTSVIEDIAPQLRPARDEDRVRVETEFAEDAVTAKAKVTPRTKEAFLKMGISPAVAELMSARDFADIAAKAKDLTAQLEQKKVAALKEAESIREVKPTQAVTPESLIEAIEEAAKVAPTKGRGKV